ncbi:MAG: hypothetical protein WBE34_18280 [Candidatus Nitrosopolaris sp.]
MLYDRELPFHDPISTTPLIDRSGQANTSILLQYHTTQQFAIKISIMTS